jgi:hypothetical protein
MYVKVTNGMVETYPYSIGQLRKDNRNVSFPANPSNDLLAEYGIYPVVSTPEPAYDMATQRVVWGVPVFVEGQWTHTWDTVSLSAEEQQSIKQSKENDIRNERNRLLVESDWTQVLDAPVDRTAWSSYRQSLRDITDQPGFPWSVTWPVSPT